MDVRHFQVNGKPYSALCYSFIDMDDMQGMGLGYLLHAIASDVGSRLGVDGLVVLDVISNGMHALCNGAGMSRGLLPGTSNYSIAVLEGKASFTNKAIEKGWLPNCQDSQPEFHQST